MSFSLSLSSFISKYLTHFTSSLYFTASLHPFILFFTTFCLLRHFLSPHPILEIKRKRKKMEKALTKVGSMKAAAGSFWVTKKAKEELIDLSQDLSAVSNVVEEKAKWLFNKLKGKPSKSLSELLREYNLPPGLFPENITCYEFDETKAKLIVYLPHPSEVIFKDSSALRYATRVKAILLRGKMMGIDGMKTKVLVWVKVASVGIEGNKSDKVWFTAGVKKSRPRDAYETPHIARRVEEF